MSTCRTRRSTSPTETSRSTSAPRSSPAATSPRRSRRRSGATSTSRRDAAKASTRSSSASARQGRPQGPLHRRPARRVGATPRQPSDVYRVYRGRTGKFVLHVERDAGLRRASTPRASRPAGAASSASATSATASSPGESTLEVVDTARRAPREGPAASSSTWSRPRPSSRPSRTSTSRPASPAREPREAPMTGARAPRPRSAHAGCASRSARSVVLDGIDLDVAAGTVFALLGPNGAGKTTTVQILSTLIAADGGEVQVAGHDVAREPDAVRAAIGVTGQFSAVDNLLTGEENLHPDGRPAPPRQARGPAARRRAARAVRPGRRGAEAARDLLRRHAAPARPRDDAGRRPADHLPRRADHRPRPAQPPRRCGRSSATSSPTASRSS